MPKEFSRIDRVADLIQRELAMIIQREMHDPRTGMVTISRVKISKDLAHAKIFVTVLPDQAAQTSLETLNNAAGFLRGELGKRIKIYMIPALFFVYDDESLKANRLSKIIDEAVKSDQRAHASNLNADEDPRDVEPGTDPSADSSPK